MRIKMIIDQMKLDMLNARKNKNVETLSILSTVLGEMMANAAMIDNVKVVTDEAAIKIIKKYIKGAEEMMTHSGIMSQIALDKLVSERDILEKYLPKMLNGDEIRRIMTAEIESGEASIGSLMKKMKIDYANLYDGKLASQIANNLLKGN